MNLKEIKEILVNGEYSDIFRVKNKVYYTIYHIDKMYLISECNNTIKIESIREV